MPTADNSFDNPTSHPERVIPDWSHGRPADGPNRLDPAFVRKVDGVMAPIENLIEDLWERLDELKADPDVY